MATITFDKTEFPSISFQELIAGYNQIALDDLSQHEQTSLYQFFAYLGESINEFDPNHVLLVKADSQGIVTNLYGASIFRNDSNQLVLKCGANEFIVEQSPAGFRCGQLEGTISFASQPVRASVKGENDEPKEVEFYPATIDFMPDDGKEVEYKIRCAWDIATEPEPARIKSTIKRKESIAPYFRAVPSGSGTGIEAIKMQELGDGRYEVTGWRVVPTEKYGDRFILKLADGREVWSRGNVDSQLSSGYTMRPGVLLDLIVSGCRQRNDGKWTLNAALRERKQELAAVGATGEKSEFDDMPF